MSDGCTHVPPENIPGYEVKSFVAGPQSGPGICVVTSSGDSSHVFDVHNFHLYDVEIEVNAESVTKEVEICGESSYISERSRWIMAGKVPAAPYHPSKREDFYGKRRFTIDVRSITSALNSQDTILMDFSIKSPVQGPIPGADFNVLVKLT